MTLDSAWKHREAADPQWAERAACIGMTDVMFGFVTSRRLGVNWSRARKVCASCPVRDACLEHALANDETDGMWGGKSPGERVGLAVRRTHVCTECSAAYEPVKNVQKVCSDECRRVRIRRQETESYRRRTARLEPRSCVQCNAWFHPLSLRAETCSEECRTIRKWAWRATG